MPNPGRSTFTEQVVLQIPRPPQSRPGKFAAAQPFIRSRIRRGVALRWLCSASPGQVRRIASLQGYRPSRSQLRSKSAKILAAGLTARPPRVDRWPTWCKPSSPARGQATWWTGGRRPRQARGPMGTRSRPRVFHPLVTNSHRRVFAVDGSSPAPGRRRSKASDDTGLLHFPLLRGDAAEELDVAGGGTSLALVARGDREPCSIRSGSRLMQSSGRGRAG